MIGLLQSPRFMKRFNGIMTLIWIIMIPIAIMTGWINSVPFVSALSLWALVASHLSAWTAARVEEKQDEEIENNK